MANLPISGLPAAGSMDDADLFEMVDVSDTSEAPTGTSKRVTRANTGLARSDHNHDATYAALSHNHNASDLNAGTLADARVAPSNVTQHQAALAITESQISDLGSYAAAAHTHAAADIVSGTMADARIAQTNVTQYEGALSIDEAQVDVDATGQPATSTNLAGLVDEMCFSVSEGGGTDRVSNIVSCTQAEYNGLTPNATTFYIITDA